MTAMRRLLIAITAYAIFSVACVALLLAVPRFEDTLWVRMLILLGGPSFFLFTHFGMPIYAIGQIIVIPFLMAASLSVPVARARLLAAIGAIVWLLQGAFAAGFFGLT